jgi:CheY-like chemotaxis protein
MAGGVAHDFNNLLTGILGQAQLISLRSNDPVLKEKLGVIEQAALDGAETVRRILGFARKQAEATYAPVDLQVLLPQVLEVTRPRWKDEAQGRGVTIGAVLALEPVPPVLGNAAEVREVLVNLIFNAVDAMPRGGRLTLGARRCLKGLAPSPGPGSGATAGAPRETVEITVRDTGVGMPEAVRRRALDPFFTTKGVKGSGLGLSMVYGIVSRHGGELLLDSTEGAGTTVTVRLPAAARAPAPPAEAALPQAARRGRIVVVDDEEALAGVLGEVLRLQGHEVTVFTEPQRALDHLAGAGADLLFTDLGMPELSGWDVARRALALHPDLPVILVTGWGQQIEPALVRARGITALVAKPYRVAEILQVVSRLLTAEPGVRIAE